MLHPLRLTVHRIIGLLAVATLLAGTGVAVARPGSMGDTRSLVLSAAQRDAAEMNPAATRTTEDIARALRAAWKNGDEAGMGAPADFAGDEVIVLHLPLARQDGRAPGVVYQTAWRNEATILKTALGPTAHNTNVSVRVVSAHELVVSAILRYTDADGVNQASPWQIHYLVADGFIVAAWCPC